MAAKRSGPCTPVDLFSCGGAGGAGRSAGGGRSGIFVPIATVPEGPAAVSRPSVEVGEERIREPIGCGRSRGSRRRVLVTIEVRTLGPCRTREEPAGCGVGVKVYRNHREIGAVW